MCINQLRDKFLFETASVVGISREIGKMKVLVISEEVYVVCLGWHAEKAFSLIISGMIFRVCFMVI